MHQRKERRGANGFCSLLLVTILALMFHSALSMKLKFRDDQATLTPQAPIPIPYRFLDQETYADPTANTAQTQPQAGPTQYQGPQPAGPAQYQGPEPTQYQAPPAPLPSSSMGAVLGTSAVNTPVLQPEPIVEFTKGLYDNPSPNPPVAPPPPPGGAVVVVRSNSYSEYQSTLPKPSQGSISYQGAPTYQGPVNAGQSQYQGIGQMGPPGPPGPKGPKGEKGDKGDPGRDYDSSKIEALNRDLTTLQKRIGVIDQLEKQIFPPWAIADYACPDKWIRVGYFESEKKVHCKPPESGDTPGNIKCKVEAKFPEHYDRCGWSKYCKVPWAKYNCYPYVVGTNIPVDPATQSTVLTAEQEIQAAEALKAKLLSENSASSATAKSL